MKSILDEIFPPWTPPSELRGVGCPGVGDDRKGAVGVQVQTKLRQCAFVKRDGMRCQLNAMVGFTLCHNHGGKRPMNRSAARKRLLELCEPALAVHAEIMEDTTCEPADRLRAANSVLDRAGFSAKQQLTISDKRESLDGASPEALFERGRAIAAELERRRAARKALGEHVIDAEVSE